MNTILNIARKEFIDTLRDKRTLIVMIIVPLLLFPIIFTMVGNIQRSTLEEARERELKVGLLSSGQYTPLFDYMEKNENLRFVQVKEGENYQELIKVDTLDAVIAIDPGFGDAVGAMKTGEVKLYYESTEEGVESRIKQVVEGYEETVVAKRLASINVEQDLINPIEITQVDISTMQEKIGKFAGGIIPYIFIIFCFIGAMYPAIDLFTGEKERMTIETILTTPVKRIQLLSGKMIVVVVTGIISALLAIVGLFLGLNFADTLPSQLINVVGDILEMKFILLLLSMLIPLTIFFAGILIPISIYAKSFKEAQSIITPINIVVIVPAIVGLLPGVELTTQTAVIPIVNIALATKEIIAGTIDFGLLAIVYFTLIVIAIAGVWASVKFFSKEGNILRV